MEKFNFYVDTKCTTWYRTNFEIEANSEEEAKQRAIEFLDDRERDILPWEQIDETTEPMDVGDNGGQSTEELYDTDGNMIWDNTKTN